MAQPGLSAVTLGRVSIDLTVQQQLDRLDVPYEIFPCDPALADTANFCAAYGFKPEDSANTILVIGKSDPPVYAACVVLSHTRLDVNKVVRQRLGTRKASFAPAEETRAITGMEIGGVTVFGLPAELPIWVDARVMRRERIILGGGSRSTKVIGPPAILLKLPGADPKELAGTLLLSSQLDRDGERVQGGINLRAHEGALIEIAPNEASVCQVRRDRKS